MTETLREANEAEVSVISAVLLDPVETEEAFEILRADHFASAQHQAIWKGFEQLRLERKPIDTVLLQQTLIARGDLETAGGIDYLFVQLSGAVGTAKHAVHHAKIIRDRALERRILETADLIKQIVLKGDVAGAELAAAVEQQVLKATSDDLPEIPRRVKELVWPLVEQIEQTRDGPDHLIGIPTGLDALDELTAGYRPGQYVVVAARPSEGKTALALHTAIAATMAGRRALFVSLEMSKDELVIRLLAHESGIDSRRLELSRVRDDEYGQLSGAVGRVGALPFWIDDTPSRTVASIRAVARRWRRKEAIDLVVVDYLQLARADGQRRDRGRVEEVTEISQGLKGLARELQIPVLCCCQLSRAPEGRPDSRPRLSDLRESGAIEQDADLVVFIWNDPEFKSRIHPPTTLIVAKQRNGPKGDIKVSYERSTGRWGNWSLEMGDELKQERTA